MVMSTPFPPEEGIGNYVYNLSRKLIEKGHQVTVITRSSSWRMQTDTIGDVDVFRAPFIPCYPLHVHVHGFFVNKLFKSLESDFDIVHIHTPLSPIIKTSLPIVTTMHTSIIRDIDFIEVKGLLYFLSKMMLRSTGYSLTLKLLRRSDMITAVSKGVAQELSGYGLNPNDVEAIWNGVDETVFVPTQNKNGDRYILCTGRLTTRKGLFDLIECGKYVCDKHPDLKFIITGKGELLSKLKAKVEKLDLKDKFIFTGFVNRENLIRLYQNATLFVLPSHYEGLPTTLLEAMSCRLPVVATNISGNVDVIENGKNGISVPPKSPQKMAEVISTLLEDEELKKKLGENARKTIEQRFTWDIICDNILKCYTQILEGRGDYI
jgi:glycosyltransferase involved in cell wall biosynthesis